MKIIKKRTITEMEGGAIVEQTAWETTLNTLVQCEFRIEYPSRSGIPPVIGAMGIFVGKRIERIRFSLTPENISQPDAPSYHLMEIKLLKFEGTFLGSDDFGFRHNLAVEPKFDESQGWRFEFAEATSRFSEVPHKFDTQITAELVTADCICTESFNVSILRRHPAFNEILASVILRDVEGLRQAISDVAGDSYLSKLLRMHGYETDRDGVSR
jgi:hypothetical protein